MRLKRKLPLRYRHRRLISVLSRRRRRRSASRAPEDTPVPTPPAFLEPKPAPEREAETLIQPQLIPPSEPQINLPPEPVSAPIEQWTPPPAPDAAWQNEPIGSNTPFQPPPAGAGGENRTLAIISMISGILSCLCCFSIITGPAGLICGWIAKKNIAENPGQYGGAGLATVGMITGTLGIVIFIVLIIVQIFFGTLNAFIR